MSFQAVVQDLGNGTISSMNTWREQKICCVCSCLTAEVPRWLVYINWEYVLTLLLTYRKNGRARKRNKRTRKYNKWIREKNKQYGIYYIVMEREARKNAMKIETLELYERF